MIKGFEGENVTWLALRLFGLVLEATHIMPVSRKEAKIVVPMAMNLGQENEATHMARCIIKLS